MNNHLSTPTLLKGSKKVCSFLLCMLMLLSILFVPIPSTYAANEAASEASLLLSDISGHWAQKQIQNWLSKDLITGYPNKTFKPDNSITRAEFIALANRSFKFSATAQYTFSDVKADEWFTGDIARASAAGYISGYQDGTFKPGMDISRQEAASIIARILKLDTGVNQDNLNQFKDKADFPDWSKAAIARVVEQGIMHGYPDKTFGAQRPISRAEALVALDGALNTMSEPTPVPVPKETSYDKSGTYGPTTGEKTIAGDVTISAAGVTLRNSRIEGNLLLGEGIGEGDVTLKNVTVTGNTTIKGGGSNSILLENCNMPEITVDKSGVRVVASGKTSINLVQLDSGAVLIELGLTAPGFDTVIIRQTVPSNTTISLQGQFSNINVNAANVNVNIGDGKVENLTLAETAKNSAVSIAENASVNTLTMNAAATISGKGSIFTAKLNVSGYTIEQQPGNVETASGVTGTIGGTGLPGGGSHGSGGGTGGGDGNNPLNLVSSDPSDGSSGVSTTPRIKLSFDRGVVRDFWDNNRNCITMTTISGTPVSVDVSRIADNDSEKRNIYVAPASALTAGETYKIIINSALKANNGNTMGHDVIISFTVAAAPPSGGGGGIIPPAAPAYTSSEVTAQGDVSIAFNKDMEDTAALDGKEGQFTVLVDGVQDTVTGLSRTNTLNKIKLTLNTKINNCGQVVTVAYTKDADASKQVKASDGGILESFGAQAVNNGLPAAPVLGISEVNAKGDISLQFDKVMAVPDKDAPYPDNMADICAQFVLTVDGVQKDVTAVITTNTDGMIKLVVAAPKITAGQSVILTYTQGDETVKLKAADGGVLANFGPLTIQ